MTIKNGKQSTNKNAAAVRDVDDDDYDQSLFYFTLLYLTLL